MNKILVVSVMILVMLFNLSVFNISIFNTSTAYASSRTALVIGNSKYKSAPLKNPANDARDIADLLRKCNFDVKLMLNASHREMKMAVRSFGKTLRQSRGTGLFYYAGHGIQLKNRNYLIPVNSTIESAGDVEFEAVDAGLILNKMEDAGNKLNIVILDACRNNPFTRSFRSSAPGLARMDAPTGSLVAYATAPGSVAADGDGRNGIYTKHLLKNMRKPGLTIEQVLKNVRVSVLSETGKKQTPWELSSLTGDFYFSSRSILVASSSGETSGVLQISSQPSGADIFIHGNFRGRTPVEIKNIDPGSYTVKAMLKGYNSSTRKVNVNSGRKAVVTFDLGKKASKARLYVSTIPSDCRVRILNIDPAFYNGIELEQGRYKLEVSKQGYESKTQWVNIDSDQGIDLNVELKKQVASSSSSSSGGAADQPTGQIWKDPVTGMEFVWVPKGCYQMGSNSSDAYSNEKPAHEVCLDGYWIGKYEVTQGQYKKIMGSNPSYFKSGDNYPVEEVSWNDAKRFISKLNQQSGKRFNLPSEAQWEYAARSGGKNQKYSGGNDVDKVAWYDSNSGGKTHNVGTKAPNNLGIYDMSGNVLEWCDDVYDKNAYSKHDRNNPLVLSGGSYRVIRGGSWNGIPRSVRSVDRFRVSASDTDDDVGFRLIRKN